MDSPASRADVCICQSLLISLIVSAVEAVAQGSEKLPDDMNWSYSGSSKQQNWGKSFPSCNGARQSPVDIDEMFTQVRMQFQNLQLEGWHIPSEPTIIHNNGKTVTIYVEGDHFVSGGGSSSTFRVSRLVFHWGRCNATSPGSEHSSNGMKYPSEMQIYCYNPNEFQNLDDAIKNGGRVAALAVLFEVSSEDNENFSSIVEAINDVSRLGRSRSVDAFTLRSLSPNITDKYYIYNGSSTTPPCFESVEWIVFKHTVAISEAQSEVFCEVMTMEQDGYVMLTDYSQNNFREQQQQFMGQVFASYTGVEDVPTPTCSSEPQNVQADAQNDTTIVVTWERPRVVFDTTIDWYTVTYQRLQGRDQNKQEYRTDGDQDVGAIITSSSANSSYVVQVVAFCTNGLKGRWSDQIVVDMPLEEPESDSTPATVTKEAESPKEVSDVGGSKTSENQIHSDLASEEHSPVEEITADQTRVYQIQPTANVKQSPTDQTQGNQHISVQTDKHLTPKTPSESARPQEALPDSNMQKKASQNRSTPHDGDQSWIEDDQSIPANSPFTSPSFDSTSAIWVNRITEEPGLLFPVARTTMAPSGRRQITEEASLSVSSLQPIDHDLPEQVTENTSTNSESFTAPMEDIQVTDVFYEDTVKSSPSENITYPPIESTSVVPGNKVHKDSSSNPEDNGATVNKPEEKSFTPDSADLSSEWITENTATAGNTLSDSFSKSFTSTSLLRGSMHTTQPSFNEGSNSSHESRVGSVEGVEKDKRTIVPSAVVSTLTTLCSSVLVGILIYWRNCFQAANFYPDDPASPKVSSVPSTPLSLPTDCHEPSTVKQFVKHVSELHSTNTFSREFEEVQACTVDMGITADSSNHPDNKSKNRYINISAYDHSRVKLSNSLDGDGKCGDYINANFVDGYERTRAYIAAQGPSKASREDFWRMIWQQNVGVIVMITNSKEKGRTKCDQYWPEEQQEEYGAYQVASRSTKTLAYYTLRTFTVRDTSNKVPQKRVEHTVSHYHYTQWPDMGVPEYTLPLSSFIRASSPARTQEMGPVSVHCSAGVGRTGTYIVIDSMLQQIQDQGTVNVLGFSKHVRTQRNFSVQTEEQYVFIHDASVEAISSRDTAVTSDLLHSYVSDLSIPSATGRTRMDKQFKSISQRQAKHADYSTASKDGNAERNRARALMPVERSRVSSVASETNSTGYINASYVTGYRCCKEFIVSQTPSSSTVEDFWRMIWEHNTQTVVRSPDSHSQNEKRDCCIYWPSKDSPMSFDGFIVTYTGEELIHSTNDESLLVQDFTMQSPQNDCISHVRQFSTPCWPNPDSPIRNSFDLVSIVRERCRLTREPVVVHDPSGGATSGSFCALTTSFNQSEEEGTVDVYMVARMTNLMRPGVFNDIEQYQYSYRAIVSSVSSQEDQRASQSPETNGSVPSGQSNTTESSESLM